MTKFLLIPLALLALLVMLTLITVAGVLLALVSPLLMLLEPIDHPAVKVRLIKYADYTGLM